MIYLIYVTWQNTKDNHAGMKNLCQKLEKTYPQHFKAIEALCPKIEFTKKKNFLYKILNKIVLPLKSRWKLLTKIRYKHIKLMKSLNLMQNDSVILMEYMLPEVNQYEIAKILKKKYPKNKVYGVAHLVPSVVDEMFNGRNFCKWTSSVDYIITLGSSLSSYYNQRGISNSKIMTSFHYVDEYYTNSRIFDNEFKVLVQGNQMRDINLLLKIINSNPDINFVICQGVYNLSELFKDNCNVTLMPFLEEADLKILMSECPVSLNVMKDTVGSNVITTSMGMGQAMICSDVGSIRDYCDESNCIFCTSEREFSDALRFLKNNKETLISMRKASLKKSSRLSIAKFAEYLLEEIENRK